MSGSSKTFEVVRSLAYRPDVNRLLRGLLRPVAALGPPRFLRRIPVVGRFEIDLPETGTTAVLSSAGGDGILRRLYWGLGFEEPVRRLWAQLARRSHTILDVGANTGLYAVIAGLVSPEARIHAFEPVPAAYCELVENLRANGLDRAQAHAVALGDSNGPVSFYVPESQRHIPTTASLDSMFRPGAKEVTVEGLRLDTFAEKQGLDEVDLIKLDVESAEPQVLAGASETLERSRPIVLCEVLEGLTETALHDVFRPLEYRFFRISPGSVEESRDIRGSHREEEANHLFVPLEKVAELASSGWVKPWEASP